MTLPPLIIIWSMVFCPDVLADQNLPDMLKAAHACREIDDRMQRLLCFDNLFDTPVAQTMLEASATKDLPASFHDGKAGEENIRPIGRMIEQMERSRAGEQGWITHIRQWNGDEVVWQGARDSATFSEAELVQNNRSGHRIDIFMTMNEIGNETAREREAEAGNAALLLSCDNDITTLGLLLPHPIDTLTVGLALSGAGGLSQRLNWRNVEQGTLLIAGRGLESIDTIKAIANSPRVQFQVNYRQGSRAFVFNMHNLKDKLRAFRLACHW